MIPSCIVFWLKLDALGPGNNAEKLQRLSKEMKEMSRQNRCPPIKKHDLSLLFALPSKIFQEPSRCFVACVFGL